jgi:hypothetical protein
MPYMNQALVKSAWMACLSPGSSASQSWTTRAGLADLDQTGRHDDDRVPGTIHGEDVLKEPERDLGKAAIDIRHTALENADDGHDRGGKGAVAAAADKGQLVADANLKISRQNSANDDLLRHCFAQEAAILDQTGQARDPGLELRLDTRDLESVAAVGARDEGEGRRPRGDLIGCQANAQLFCEPCHIRNHLTHLVVILVAGRLHLEVTGLSPQGVVDHHPVHSDLERDHEDEEDVGEDHRADRQPGSALASPEVSPGESEGDVFHQLLSGVLEV